MKMNETPPPTVCLTRIHVQFFVADSYPCSSLMTTLESLKNGICGFFTANTDVASDQMAVIRNEEPLHPFLMTAITSRLYDDKRGHLHLIGLAVVAIRPETVREEAFVADAAWSANAITKWLLEENPDVSFHTDALIELNSGKQNTFLPRIKIH